VRSVDQLGHFDAFADVDKIATLPFSKGAMAKAGDAAKLFTIEGATHLGLYDLDEYVTPAVATLTEFFEQHLAKA
jgi:fermentation-respiration switch protein FrsA (DUF1100 family)